MQKQSWCDRQTASLFERRRRARRVRMIVDLTAKIIHSDDSMTYREARSLVICARKAILDLLPQYEEQFEKKIVPQFDQIIGHRWPLEHQSTFIPASELVN